MLEGNKGLLIVSILRGLGALSSIGLVYVVYYFYTPAISAEFFLFISFCAFISVLLRFGLDDYILKTFSGTKQSNPHALILKATLLSLIITLIIVPLLHNYYQFNIPWYYFLVLPLMIVNSLYSSFFQARKNFYISLIGFKFS